GGIRIHDALPSGCLKILPSRRPARLISRTTALPGPGDHRCGDAIDPLPAGIDVHGGADEVRPTRLAEAREIDPRPDRQPDRLPVLDRQADPDRLGEWHDQGIHRGPAEGDTSHLAVHGHPSGLWWSARFWRYIKLPSSCRSTPDTR